MTSVVERSGWELAMDLIVAGFSGLMIAIILVFVVFAFLYCFTDLCGMD